MNKIDLVDKRLGRLVVMAESDQRLNGRTTWRCKCDCGNTTLDRIDVNENYEPQNCRWVKLRITRKKEK